MNAGFLHLEPSQNVKAEGRSSDHKRCSPSEHEVNARCASHHRDLNVRHGRNSEGRREDTNEDGKIQRRLGQRWPSNADPTGHWAETSKESRNMKRDQRILELYSAMQCSVHQCGLPCCLPSVESPWHRNWYRITYSLPEHIAQLSPTQKCDHGAFETRSLRAVGYYGKNRRKDKESDRAAAAWLSPKQIDR